MTEPATSVAARAPIGPGRLVLVVGPSGAGKDTLIGIAKAACAGYSNIVFPQRIVTRPPSASEDNFFMSPDEFRATLARGGFAMHWEAHGHFYGLPRAIDDDIAAGRTVVVNVSRTVVDALRAAYAHVTVVLVTAPPKLLAERIAARAREDLGAIKERVERSVDETAFKADLTVNNVGSAEQHGAELAAIIQGH
jgi:ribose 1,5-bisphosphokinase